MRTLSGEEVQHHVENIQESGYSIMENAIGEDFQAAIHAELARLEQVRPGGDIPPGPFTGFTTRRWFDVLNDGDMGVCVKRLQKDQ